MRKWALLSVFALSFALAPAEEPPGFPVSEASWADLDFEGLKAGDWVEYAEEDTRWKIALVKADEATVWIETNRAILPRHDVTFLVEIDRKTRIARRAWRQKKGSAAEELKLDPKADRSKWTEEMKKEFEASKPKLTNRKGRVSRETLKVGDRDLQCTKVVMENDVEERGEKYHDVWTDWYAEDVPAFERLTVGEHLKEIAWEGDPLSCRGGQVRMTRTDGTGKLRWEIRLVGWGHDAKATMPIPDK